MTKKLRLLILCFLFVAQTSTGGPAETLDKPAVIQSPTDWALGYFHSSRGEGSHITRSLIDLDHDGTEELFIGWTAARGRNGIPFVVFQQSTDGYLFLGELFIREDFRAFKVLPLADDGKLRFAQYWAHGGCEGTIAISTHEGTRFSVVKSEKICAGDSGTEQGIKRFREVFGD